MVGDYLKKADKCLKENDFEGAEREVASALKEDPKSLYAIAYRDRIVVARKLYEERMSSVSLPPPVKIPPIHSHPPPVTTSSSIKVESPRPVQESIAIPVLDGELNPNRERYRQLMMQSWRTGSLSLQAAASLDMIRVKLNISIAEHLELESDVKAESYVSAMRKGILDNTISLDNLASLESLQRKYGITSEDHIVVERKLLRSLFGKERKGTILFVDDDLALVELIQMILSEVGYQVVTATSPEQAIHELKNLTPDLILCDIRFPESTLDGYAIYDFVRSAAELVAVPFIFLTAVKDEAMERLGLQLGVDDYLTKPFNNDTLHSVIEGKLKRYRELKRSRR